MGAVNTALLVGLAAPATLRASWAAELAEGLAAEATRAGAGVVGGDTARADTITLSVTALGDLEGRRPVLRSGARPGDVIAVVGTLGHAAAGLALLAAGLTAGPTPLPDTLSTLVAVQLRPSPPYDAGPEAARLGATAMIDVSDGLLADLSHVATASEVRINVETASLLPLAAPLREAASLVLSHPTASVLSQPKSSQPTPPAPHTAEDSAALALDWVLTGGEDHPLVAAFPPETPLPPRWRLLGEVLCGTGVTLDGTPRPGPPGWQHFA
jgi:thiamine-monophosphate kinase